MFYGLSETKIRYVLRRPDRIEEGIALRTTAVMQKTGSQKNPSEIWVMYQKKLLRKKRENSSLDKLKNILERGEKIIVISAWRYPGISPQGPPPIPENIIREIGEIL